MSSVQQSAVEFAASVRNIIDAAGSGSLDESSLRRGIELASQLERELSGAPTSADAVPRQLLSAGHGLANPWAPFVAKEQYDVDSLEARYRLHRAHQGYRGLVHGGVIALLFDDVCGRLVRYADRSGFTAHLGITYVHPVSIGDVIVRARIVRCERRKTSVAAKLTLPNHPETILASADALFVSPRLRAAD